MPPGGPETSALSKLIYLASTHFQICDRVKCLFLQHHPVSKHLGDPRVLEQDEFVPFFHLRHASDPTGVAFAATWTPSSLTSWHLDNAFKEGALSRTDRIGSSGDPDLVYREVRGRYDQSISSCTSPAAEVTVWCSGISSLPIQMTL